MEDNRVRRRKKEIRIKIIAKKNEKSDSWRNKVALETIQWSNENSKIIKNEAGCYIEIE